MTTYYTPMLRTSMGNVREFYIEEFPIFNSLKDIHIRFGLVFNSYADAENKAYEIIAKEGGRFIGKLPPYIGRSKGSRKHFKMIQSRHSEETLT